MIKEKPRANQVSPAQQDLNPNTNGNNAIVSGRPTDVDSDSSTKRTDTSAKRENIKSLEDRRYIAQTKVGTTDSEKSEGLVSQAEAVVVLKNDKETLNSQAKEMKKEESNTREEKSSYDAKSNFPKKIEESEKTKKFIFLPDPMPHSPVLGQARENMGGPSDGNESVKTVSKK